jgi:hypothetical protein
MEYPSNLLDPVNAVSASATLPGRRLHYRQKLSTLAYVNLDHSNGGIVRDLSEVGIAIQTVTPLGLNQQVQLRFELQRPRLHLETLGRVAWADQRGQAGIQFLNLSDRAQRSLKQWIFTQLLARAQQVADAGFVFHSSNPTEGPTQLLFSTPPRQAIRLEPQARSSRLPDQSPLHQNWPDRKSQDKSLLEMASAPALMRRQWLPFPVSHRIFARVVDGLILLTALLLFSVLAMTVTQIFPSWPVAAALALVVTGVFVAVYWFLFVTWMGATPGARLARLASCDLSVGEEEDRPRFR